LASELTISRTFGRRAKTRSTRAAIGSEPVLLLIGPALRGLAVASAARDVARAVA